MQKHILMYGAHTLLSMADSLFGLAIDGGSFGRRRTEYAFYRRSFDSVTKQNNPPPNNQQIRLIKMHFLPSSSQILNTFFFRRCWEFEDKKLKPLTI
ncbi:unnamed protein product [Citrullus colocynthis]|uniref:Uncharacterized protein n=1 Tax=Citrullus colocynthis TaxID=252529 RepID=A0ABP0Y7E7_9ROSI